MQRRLQALVLTHGSAACLHALTNLALDTVEQLAHSHPPTRDRKRSLSRRPTPPTTPAPTTRLTSSQRPPARSLRTATPVHARHPGAPPRTCGSGNATSDAGATTSARIRAELTFRGRIDHTAQPPGQRERQEGEPVTNIPDRTEQITTFFAANPNRLYRTVASSVHAPRELIDRQPTPYGSPSCLRRQLRALQPAAVCPSRAGRFERVAHGAARSAGSAPAPARASYARARACPRPSRRCRRGRGKARRPTQGAV